MICLVIDTNVLVGACFRDSGSAREVVRRCLSGSYRPLMGAALFMECEDVFGRDEIFSRSPLSREQRHEVLAGFMAVCQWTEVFFAWRPNLPDESDNHLIELAVAGGASAIVTRNTRDFKRAELRFPNLQILTPERCLEVHK